MRLFFWPYIPYNTILGCEMKNPLYDFSRAQVAENTQTALSEDGMLLYQMLEYAARSSEERKKTLAGDVYHVSNIGKLIGGAYEKLRNTTENTEQHLLLQRAIRRYLYRNLFVDVRNNHDNLTEEMVIELTHGGYLPQDAVTTTQIKEATKIIRAYRHMYDEMRYLKPSDGEARTWILDVMSVECEWVFSDPSYLFAFMHYAHSHVLGKLKEYNISHESLHVNEIALMYYAAILKNIIKADKAMARAVLVRTYRVNDSTEAFIRLNQDFERISDDKEAKVANALVNKIGAPLRILRAAFFDEDKNKPDVLYKKQAFLAHIERTARQQYELAQSKLNNGIVRSIVFLIITKVLIGVAIEVPFDLWLYGEILLLPLAINLLAPPLFMVIQRFTLKVPGPRNTEALREYIDMTIYERQGVRASGASKGMNTSNSRTLGILYSFFSVAIFIWFAWRLSGWGFNIVQGIIFFIFLSTATFLGYRLSLIIKDLELIQTNQTIAGFIRDFIYTPFILLGRWISGTYSRFNIIAVILDFAIELPIKTVLRRARQWVTFLDEKKDMLN